jgi:hypothetical protein
MLIDSFIAVADAAEKHSIHIVADGDVVYRALWDTDLGGSWIIRGLLGLRALPQLVIRPARSKPSRGGITLRTIISAGFGVLAEEPGHEIVLGVMGRFWRPVGNLLPFKEENFSGPVPAGLARAVWNFAVHPLSDGSSLLITETRVVCGDRASRRKFRAYWILVRPFSGLIRRLMLKAVKRACGDPP